MRERRGEGTIDRQRDGQFTNDAVEEPVDVVALVGLGTVDVLRAVGRPIEAQRSSVALKAKLLVVLLDIPHLNEGLVSPGLVHAAGAHVRVGLGTPGGHGRLHVLCAHVLVVKHIIARGDSFQSTSEAAILQVRPTDLDTSGLEIPVAVEGWLVPFRSTIHNHRDLHIFGKLQRQVVAQFAVAAAFVLHHERGRWPGALRCRGRGIRKGRRRSGAGEHDLVPIALDGALVLAKALVLRAVPREVLLKLMLWLPAQDDLGLFNKDTKVRLTEGEFTLLGELNAFEVGRVVVHNLRLLANNAGNHVG
mmetsp:Transcript_57803/g.159848  ORF Transcript_57803/g.159848 Transcript_57803/m.159848 type:complete len:305 (-) Transcript_57803:798-1712(-)